ncbi:hypothetical protein SEA_CLUBPENGUIN_44 [Streptomyces phage ClubPenguin]|nr:hypothetical protein SEA_CLUBPENGUIN_44 [Streptomyces phage ClubPenguin]
MNPVKQKLVSAKEAVVRNKTKILATTTVVATGAAVLMRIGLHQHNDFLREKGLYEEFYTLDED